MAFDITKVNQFIFPFTDTAISTVSETNIQLRITKNSRFPLFGRQRGIYNSGATYFQNDLVWDTTTVRMWQAIDATPFSAVAPAEDGIHWTRACKFDWAEPDPSKVLILNDDYRVFAQNGVGILARHISKEEGNLTPENRQFVFVDQFDYAGWDGAGNPVSGNFLDVSNTFYTTTLFNTIFNNSAAMATASLNRVLDITAVYTDVNGFELYWEGEASVQKNTVRDIAVINERTGMSSQVQAHTAMFDGGASRALSFTVRDFIQLFQESDMVTGKPMQIVGGYILKNGAKVINASGGGFNQLEAWNAFDYPAPNGNNWPDPLKQNRRLNIAAISTNDNLHLVLDSVVLTKLCQVMMNDTFVPTDCTTGMTFWSDVCSQTTSPSQQQYTSKQILPGTGHSILESVGTIFEYLFGCDPRCNFGVAPMSSSISLNWSDTLQTLIAKLCRRYICSPVQGYNQNASVPWQATPTKVPTLILSDLRALNVVTGPATGGAITLGATTVALVTGGSAILEAAAAAAGWTVTGGSACPFFAQIQANGLSQTIYVTANAADSITFTLKDASLAWATGAQINPVKLLPTEWTKGEESREDARIISAGHVEVKTANFDDTLSCPWARGSAMSIEIDRQAKKVAPLNSFGDPSLPDTMYNTQITQDNQNSVWKTFTGGYGGNGRFIRSTAQAVTYDVHDVTGIGDIYTIDSSGADLSNLICVSDTDMGHEAWQDGPGMSPPTFQQAPYHLIANFTDHSIAVGAGNSVFIRLGGGGSGVDVIIFENGCYGYVESQSQGTRNHFSFVCFDHTAAWSTDAGYGFGGLAPVPPAAPCRYVIGFNWFATDCVVTDGSRNISSARTNFAEADVFGNPIVGQQIIIPDRGVFTIIGYGPNGDTTDVHTAYLSAPISVSGTGLDLMIGGPEINSDGWVPGSFLFYHNTTDFRFPLPTYADGHGDPSGSFPFSAHSGGTDTVASTNPDIYYFSTWRNCDNSTGTGTLPNYAQGAYTISRACYGPPVGNTGNGSTIAPDDNHGNLIYTAAQVYASIFIGTAGAIDTSLNLIRNYSGVTDNAGSLVGWDNGDSFIEYRDGNLRCFQVIGNEIKEIGELGAGALTIFAQEWPNFSAPLDDVSYPVQIAGSGAGSGSAAGIGGGSNVSSGGSGGTSTTLTTNNWTVLSPNALAADTINWNLGLPSGFVVIRISSTAAISLRGLIPSSGTFEVKFVNVGTFPITLTNEDTASFAANRFHASSPIPVAGAITILEPGAPAIIWYDPVLARWRFFSNEGG